MGINFVFKSKITFNGVEYESPDQMPPEVRKSYERVMAMASDSSLGGPNVATITKTSGKIVFNGVEYKSPDEMPPDVRESYDKVTGFLSANGPRENQGGPLIGKSAATFQISGQPAPAVRSPLNLSRPAVSAGGAPSNPRMTVAVAIIIALALVIACLLVLLLKR